MSGYHVIKDVHQLSSGNKLLEYFVGDIDLNTLLEYFVGDIDLI